MVPPDSWTEAYRRTRQALLDGRAEIDGPTGTTPFSMSTWVKLEMVAEALGDLAPVLRHFGISGNSWQRGNEDHRRTLMMPEMCARYDHLRERLDVTAELATIRAAPRRTSGLLEPEAMVAPVGRKLLAVGHAYDEVGLWLRAVELGARAIVWQHPLWSDRAPGIDGLFAHGDRLFVAHAGRIVAFELATGKSLWNLEASAAEIEPLDDGGLLLLAPGAWVAIVDRHGAARTIAAGAGEEVHTATACAGVMWIRFRRPRRRFDVVRAIDHQGEEVAPYREVPWFGGKPGCTAKSSWWGGGPGNVVRVDGKGFERHRLPQGFHAVELACAANGTAVLCRTPQQIRRLVWLDPHGAVSGDSGDLGPEPSAMVPGMAVSDHAREGFFRRQVSLAIVAAGYTGGGAILWAISAEGEKWWSVALGQWRGHRCHGDYVIARDGDKAVVLDFRTGALVATHPS